MIVPARKVTAKDAKIKLCFEVSNPTISWLVNVLFCAFASITIIKPPIPINEKAGISYFQFIFSFKYLTARNVLKAMAVIELVDISTRSTHGRTPT